MIEQLSKKKDINIIENKLLFISLIFFLNRFSPSLKVISKNNVIYIKKQTSLRKNISDYMAISLNKKKTSSI